MQKLAFKAKKPIVKRNTDVNVMKQIVLRETVFLILLPSIVRATIHTVQGT